MVVVGFPVAIANFCKSALATQFDCGFVLMSTTLPQGSKNSILYCGGQNDTQMSLLKQRKSIWRCVLQESKAQFYRAAGAKDSNCHLLASPQKLQGTQVP